MADEYPPYEVLPSEEQLAEEDFDPEHPDLQHEDPPYSAPTDDPVDLYPGEGEEADPGELPADIPDAPAEFEPIEGGD